MNTTIELEKLYENIENNNESLKAVQLRRAIQALLNQFNVFQLNHIYHQLKNYANRENTSNISNPPPVA